ncbi:MAG TPA: PD-(D/E)XK nuclease family protein [Spirochaetota bacterium]|nr:PD-(D/E)XK nuclease family protein [Spirochaetota bacterium]
MSTATYTALFSKVQTISNLYAKLAERHDDGFNIFEIMRMQSDEVHLHSRFIAELLNPKGTHGLGKTYLQLFLDKLPLRDSAHQDEEQRILVADGSTVNISVEKDIGPIDPVLKKGGKIDILVHSSEMLVAIENKIYAREQDDQIARYQNYLKEQQRDTRESFVLFLTLYGNKPDSTLQDSGISVICISYKHHIREWLDACIEKSATRPLVRETLRQYAEAINHLTGGRTMAEDKEIIEAMKGNIAESFNIARNFKEMKVQLLEEFNAQLEKEFGKNILEKGLHTDYEPVDSKHTTLTFSIPGNEKYRVHFKLYCDRLTFGLHTEKCEGKYIEDVSDLDKYPDYAKYDKFTNWATPEPWQAIRSGELVEFVRAIYDKVVEISKTMP